MGYGLVDFLNFGNILWRALTGVQIQETFWHSTLMISWNWNRNRLVTQTWFKVTRTNTSTTTSAQRELFWEKASYSKNVVQRTLVKLKLKSMLRKCAQHQNNTQGTHVTSVKALYEIVTSPGTEVETSYSRTIRCLGILESLRGKHIRREAVNGAVAVYVT